MDTANHIELLSATAQGDRRAFESLYRQTSAKLYAISLQLLQRKDLAEEALQEAFVRVWYNASEYNQERGAVLTWMTSILRYRALDMLRAAKVRRETGEVDDENPPSDTSAAPESDLFRHRDRVKLDDCMDRLEKKQANAISLAYFRGYTHHEIVDHMELPLGSVKSWIRRGLQQLKRCLER